ncbi:DNA-binding domain-containing protein [Halochromatium glycolicum]|uniref:Putative DNA-binding domain-containing protein n=1 Tax=Halochromatium glycolicum TaxID=85075 RepID=A0AAJ0U570_9GAMM|nr:DNA-binding domain-containing protein [Halochromatium glycolicum]MBK1705518.1 hypothetical protein [Halochromatium glycolicum]
MLSQRQRQRQRQSQSQSQSQRPSLAEIQRRLAAAIDDPAAAEHLAPWLAASAPGPQQASPSALERVAIYRDSSRRARERTLEAIYPVCRQILGPRCFARLAADYIDAFASRQGNLNRYGAAFAYHLAAVQSHQPALATLAYLPDLARLEWHWHAIYYAADAPPLDAAALAQLARPEQAARVRLRLSSALRRLASAYPIAAIWLRHREGAGIVHIAAGDGDRLVIHRRDGRPQVTPVTPAVFKLLAALGRPSTQAATLRSTWSPTLGELAAAGYDLTPLPDCIAAGWISGCTLGEPG